MRKLNITIATVFLSFSLGFIANPFNSMFTTKQAYADGSGLNKIHKVGDDLQAGLTSNDQKKLRSCMGTSYCQNFERMKMGAKLTNVIYHRESARKLGATTATFLIEMERNGIVTLQRATLKKKKNGKWKICSLK